MQLENENKLLNLNERVIKTILGKYYRAVETEDHVYFVNYQEGDENAQTLMYDKETGELTSNNYFATVDLTQVCINKKYTWMSSTFKRGLKFVIGDSE